MGKQHHLKLAEFIKEEVTEGLPWANAATAFVAMKKRAALECAPEVQGLSARVYGLMEQVISEKFASQAVAIEQGLSKMAAADGAHAQYFLRKMEDEGQHVYIRAMSGTKLAAMKERSIMVMQHLCDELGNDPTRFTVEEFIREDVSNLPKLASLEVKEKEKKSFSKKAVALARVKGRVKKAQHSAISGGALRGPDTSGSRPRHEIRDAGQYTYHDNKDETQPKSSKTAGEKGLKWHERARIPAGLVGGTVAGTLGGMALGTRLAKKVHNPAMRALIAGGTSTVGGLGGMTAGAVGAAKTLKPEAKRKMIEPALREGRKGIIANLKKDPANKAFRRDLRSFDDALIKIQQKSASKRKVAGSALKVVKLMKLAAEAGMSVKEYLGAEEQAKKKMEMNELEHVRQVAEQATQENQVLSERATQAEQQLQEMQQSLQLSQQQGQMSLQAASDSEANAAEQAGAKLRMKMKIDQMRQTLADLAAINPQMDEAPGPEAGMPQPGAPPGPVQQQADAAQQAAQQPQTAEQAKQTQQAQTAQQKATQQTQQAQQANAPGTAPVPMNAGAPGAPQVPTAAPVTPAT